MRFVYLLLSGFFLFLFLLNLYNFRRKNIDYYPFLIWSISLLFLSFFSLFPSLLDFLVILLGFKLRTSFLIFILMVIFLSFIFSQLQTNNKNKRKLAKINQLISIDKFYARFRNGQNYLKKSDVLVKIAAYNEGMNLEQLLRKKPKNVDLLIIDDGSRDKTTEIAEKYGAMVVSHLENMGQGIADLTGFYIAFEMGYKYIVEMDADCQHDMADITNFINTLKSNSDVDVVVGSRVLGSQDEKLCKTRTRFLPFYTKMINWATGYSLTDGLCGFKAYRANSLTKHTNVFDGVIETEYIAAELYIRLSRLGIKVMEIPIHISQRAHGKSHKGTLRYGMAVLWIISRTLIEIRK